MTLFAFFKLCGFLNFIFSLLCGFFVFLNNPTSKTSQTFFYYSVCVSGWAFFQFWWGYVEPNHQLAMTGMRISNLFADFIPPTFFHFSTYLIGEYKRYTKLVKIVYAISILIGLTVFTPLYIPRAEPIMTFPDWPRAGLTFHWLFIEYAFVIGFSLFIIFSKYRTSHGQEKLRLKYVFIGILIAFISGSLNFPACYGIPVAPVLNILIPFYTLIITYAVFKYQLMDIQIILKKSFVYTILITVISLFYFSTIYVAEHIIQTKLGYRSLLISLGSTVVMALLFTPLKNFLQDVVEKRLFQGSLTKFAEENEQLRQEIIRSERVKTVATLAAGLAHEIKNPLTPILTFSEELPKRLDDKVFLEKWSVIIKEQALQISSLVNGLLDYAKPRPPKLQPTDVLYPLKHTLELMSSDFIKNNITVNVTFKHGNIPVLLDQSQLQQAFLNILLNSIEAMPNGGTIDVLTDSNSNHVIIQIKDTGKGIAEQDLKFIFDPFFTKKGNGTGLGLSITHEIIKNHLGKIFVTSNKDVGTTFKIQFPIFQQPLNEPFR